MWTRLGLVLALFAGCLNASFANAADDALPAIDNVEAQPLGAQAKRVAQALDFLGQPLSPEQAKLLDDAIALGDNAKSAAAIQKVLDPLCLAGVNINPESRVKVAGGPAAAKLHAARLARVPRQGSQRSRRHRAAACAEPQRRAALQAQQRHARPQAVGQAQRRARSLAGRRDVRRAAARRKALGPGAASIASCSSTAATRASARRSSRSTSARGRRTSASATKLNMLFECEPAVPVTLEVIDDDGKPTTGPVRVSRRAGPRLSRATRRLAPDFFFHDQIYRHSGEDGAAAAGQVSKSTYTRGPEYRILKRDDHRARRRRSIAKRSG